MPKKWSAEPHARVRKTMAAKAAKKGARARKRVTQDGGVQAALRELRAIRHRAQLALEALER
jgi:hypothetical protein